jgi:hypothetical protein
MESINTFHNKVKQKYHAGEEIFGAEPLTPPRPLETVHYLRLFRRPLAPPQREE